MSAEAERLSGETGSSGLAEVSFWGGLCACTCTEQTTVSLAGGADWETKSIQDWRCLASEEAELCEVIVLTGDERVPVASLEE